MMLVAGHLIVDRLACVVDCGDGYHAPDRVCIRCENACPQSMLLFSFTEINALCFYIFQNMNVIAI